MPAHRRFPRVPGTLLTRRLALGALCVTTAGAAALGISLSPASSAATTPSLAGTAPINATRLDAATRSNRSLERTGPTEKATSSSGAAKAPAKKAAGPLPHIAGLSATQVANAWAIVLEGHRMGISARGQQIAIATAMQESNLYNLRRAVDHDSLGLFQQRPSSGWGSRAQLTNPTYAAHAFYAVLVQHKGMWGCLTCAAQRVQRSAFPNAYAKHTTAALRVVQALDQRF